MHEGSGVGQEEEVTLSHMASSIMTPNTCPHNPTPTKVSFEATRDLAVEDGVLCRSAFEENLVPVLGATTPAFEDAPFRGQMTLVKRVWGFRCLSPPLRGAHPRHPWLPRPTHTHQAEPRHDGPREPHRRHAGCSSPRRPSTDTRVRMRADSARARAEVPPIRPPCGASRPAGARDHESPRARQWEARTRDG
jgi:hypothetical protein